MPKRLFLFFLSVIFLVAFTFFSYLVAKERFTQFDFDTTVKLQDHISRRFDLPFSYFSILGSAEFSSFVWLILLIFILVKRYWLTALSMSLFFMSVLAELFGKIYLLHPAPPFLFYRGVLSFHFASDYVHTNYSYPSGHTIRTAFLITFLLIFLSFKVSLVKRTILQAGLLLFYFGMLISRIYLGEHWSTDVIGGVLLGTSLGCLSALTIPSKQKIKEVID